MTGALLGRLLREEPQPIRVDDVGGWWRAFSARCPRGTEPIDRAVLAGFHADRLGFAFAGAYQAALRALVPSLPEGIVAAFCATEPGGNHPRAIETRLSPRAGGGFTLRGSKRWSTMAPLASVLLVVASEGTNAAGRKRFRLVEVPADAPGVAMAAMPAPAFIPEVPHAAIELGDVAVDRAALLPGDGYALYVKPFRTVEDVHVHAGVLGYLVSVARRSGFSRELLERIVASVVTVRALAALDRAAAETHVALAGLLAEDARLVEELDGAWTKMDASERERWRRDRPLFGSVAGQLRERRRQRAWEVLEGRGTTQEAGL